VPRQNDHKDRNRPFQGGADVDGCHRQFHGPDCHRFKPRSDDIPVEISAVNEKAVEFGGYNKSGDIVAGSIDRVTGDLEAISASGSWTTSYSLQCEPKQRMF